MDIIYIGIAAAFFILTLGLMRMCAKLGESRTEDKP
jgi:hypothetical protein